MSHKNKKSLVDQVKQSLDSKLAIGRSKHQDKLSENERKEITSNYIYSWETYRSYLKHGCYFVLWCKEKYRCKTLEECRSYADEWLEAVALKWSDIDWETREIHIHRMESLVEDENGKLKVTICEYTKKKSPAGDRYLPLSDYEINLFQTVKRINEEAGYSDGNFIFCDKVGRTKIRKVDNCIRAQCTRAGIEVKSAHDIRRTVASEMDRKKISIEDIRWYLGHNDIATTRTYIMNNQGKQKTSRQIVNALSEMNGSDVLMGTQNSRNEKSPEPF